MRISDWSSDVCSSDLVVMAGRIAEALDVLRMLYDGGADPVVVIQDLMELTHAVTRLKAAPKAAGANDLGEAERDRGRRLAETLPVPALTSSWKMLSKGLGEVQHAPSSEERSVGKEGFSTFRSRWVGNNY